ncbi:MAG: hypothetical protein ACMG5Z_05955 [Luteimonas sp.]
MATGKVSDKTLRDEAMNSPHLFSARRNRDFETMARHVNSEHGSGLTAKDVEAMMSESAPEQAPVATKRAARKR